MKLKRVLSMTVLAAATVAIFLSPGAYAASMLSGSLNSIFGMSASLAKKLPAQRKQSARSTPRAVKPPQKSVQSAPVAAAPQAPSLPVSQSQSPTGQSAQVPTSSSGASSAQILTSNSGTVVNTPVGSVANAPSVPVNSGPATSTGGSVPVSAVVSTTAAVASAATVAIAATTTSATTPSPSTASVAAVTTSAVATPISAPVLKWNIPSTRLNGGSFSASELAGYDLTYLGRKTGASGVIQVAPNLTTYSLNSLPADTYDFAIAAYDKAGNSSPLSNIVTVTVSH